MGWEAELSVEQESWNSSDFKAMISGYRKDRASSIKVPSGYAVELFRRSGNLFQVVNSEVYGDMACVNLEAGEDLSSLRIVD